MYTNQKMQKWSILPAEIFNIIIFYVNENEYSQEKMNYLSQCALTCRSWREIAQPLLFSKIKLKNFEEASENLLCLMMNNSKLGAYVKELYSWNKVKLASLITMDSLFPNLNKIGPGWDNVSSYSFFCKLITKEGKFRNLISMPFDRSSSHMYIECLFTLKSQITEVLLYDKNDEERCTYLKLCDELYQFPNLQSVYVCEYSNVSSSRNIIDYVETITVHDNLMHLEKIALRVSGCSLFKELCDVQPSTKIKDISITVDSFQNFSSTNEQFMLYIMKKFPNPSRICLLITGCINCIEQSTTAILLWFLQYLCKIQNCRVSNSISTDENTASLIKDLLSSISLQTKIKLPRIYITSEDYDSQHAISIKTVIGVNNNAVGDAHTIFIVFKKNHATGFKQQLLDLFQEAGCFFTEAILKIDTVGELVSGLNHIGKYCHKLEKLEIKAHSLLYGSLTASGEISDEAKNYSVKKLRISGSGPTSNQLCSISAHFPCLENLNINNFFGSPYNNYMFMDGEITISTFLSNSSLKYLTINPEENFGWCLDLNGLQVNITADSGQNDRISFDTEKDFYTGERVCSYFVPFVEYDNRIFDSNRNKNWIVWNIHCKSIEKLNVISHKTVIRNGKKVRLPKTLTLSF